MASFEFPLILDRLLRYYFPSLLLLPVLLILVCADKRVGHTNRKSILVLCCLLLVLILADVFEVPLALQSTYTVWRMVASVSGFCIRPICLLLLLLDLLPGIRSDRRRLLLASLPALLNGVLFCSAFFCPLAFFFDAANVYHRGPLFPVVVIVSALYLVWMAVGALINLQGRNRRKAIAVLAISLACFFASLLEMNGIAYPTPLLNQTMTIGASLYFLVQYMVSSTDAIENMTLSLLLMQIRPHFINNSLAAIRGMIRRDPETAVEALNHFSGYLQDSMNSVLKTNLIPFSQEMELIDNYLYMENTRFRGSITIQKELALTDFPVPPLTVQPLVENAVRHGLRGIQRPGQLTLRTELDKKEYRIIVADNGCGFDPSQPPDVRRPHVGLKNVRSRLELMCGGTLTLQSSPEGTTAVIHIPVRMLDALRNSPEPL